MCSIEPFRKKEAKDTGYSSDDELSSGESRHKNVMLKKGY